MTELETTIATVVVYPDRARVTRSGTAELEPGSQRLELSELPLALDPGSVRALVRGSARARLLGVDVRRAFYAETPVEQVRELEQQLEALEDEMRALDARAGLLGREQAALGELAGQAEAFARGLAFGKTDAQAQMALLDSLRSRAEETSATALALATQRREMERRQEKLQRELGQVQGARRRERYTAAVEVEVTQAGDLTVELAYVVAGAGWEPLYDVRLLEQGEGAQAVLEIGYLAQVTQRTEEDWTDVALALSTARPALAGTLPELDPWYIGPVYAERRKGAPGRLMMKTSATLPPPAAAPAQDMLAGAAMEAGLAREERVEVEEAVATVAASGAAVTYQVPGTVSIPADGDPRKVTVARFELSPELDYVCAAKLVEAAYRRAVAANDSPYTLLPGSASLFAGDEFIGVTDLELTAPQGEIELYLGIDDRIKVERELKRREVDKRVIGDKRRLRYSYQIVLENLLPSEASITLHDQLPVPRHEDIKVKLESAEPKLAEQTDLNLLDWELNLEAGQKQEVRFGFTVEHPRGMSVVGLP